MSQYNQYNGGPPQNGQYQQYATYQPYPAQSFQQINPTAQQQVQYRQLHQGLAHANLPFANQAPIPQHENEVYPDYANVYPSHDNALAASQRYGATHLTGSANYAQNPGIHHSNQGLAPLPLPKTQIPLPRSIQPAAKKPKTAKKQANFSKKSEEWEGEEASGDEYNMDGMKTKSGRKVHKPSQFNPSAKTPSKKRGAGAKKAVVLDSLFCKVCDRGHSPKSNLIVFCDGCNTPYHQLCHVPVIDNLLITLPDAEWFCATCDQRRAQSKLEFGYNGAQLTEEQKKTYLVSLPTSHLVQLVLYAHAHNPELGLFSPNTAVILENVRRKHDAVNVIEQAKLPVYQAVPGDDIPRETEDLVMEQRIIRALQNLAAQHPQAIAFRLSDIFDWIESNEPIDRANFRSPCAQQLHKSCKKGRILKEGQEYALNRAWVEQPQQTELRPQPQLRQFEEEEQYPRIEGIKLPIESAEDGFVMHETESPAFSHRL